MRETQVRPLGQEDAPEKERATPGEEEVGARLWIQGRGVVAAVWGAKQCEI